MNEERLRKRIEKMRVMADPQSPEMKQALLRIGTVLKAEIRLNIGRHRMIDQGGLINSIQYKLETDKNKATLEVGSFGITYAAINEFGGQMTQKQVRAMFVSLRERGRLRSGTQGKGVVTINKDQTGFWKARPFLRPAFIKHTNFIIDTLRKIGKW